MATTAILLAPSGAPHYQVSSRCSPTGQPTPAAAASLAWCWPTKSSSTTNLRLLSSCFLTNINDSIVFTFADARLSRHAARWPPCRHAPSSTPRLWRSRVRRSRWPHTRHTSRRPRLPLASRSRLPSWCRTRKWQQWLAAAAIRSRIHNLDVPSSFDVILGGCCIRGRCLKMNGILSVFFSFPRALLSAITTTQNARRQEKKPENFFFVFCKRKSTYLLSPENS